MKMYIRSMAFSQTQVAQNLCSKMNVTLEHLLYIVLAPTSPTVHHWCSEICAFIGQTDKLSSTKRFPKEKQIYDWTYGRKQDLVQDEKYMAILIRKAARKESLDVTLTTSEIQDRLDALCVRYFSWLAKELSSVGIVDEEDVESVIMKIVSSLE